MHGPRAAPRAWPARTVTLVTLVTLVSWVGSVGCSGAPKRTFDGTTFREGPVAFSVPRAPQGWRQVDVTSGSLAYRDDAHGASILLNARCHRPDEATPLLALTNHLLIGSTAREIVTQETVPFDGREALHTTLRAKWDGVSIAFDIYVAKKDGCTYDFVYMGDPAAYREGAQLFESFVGGFRTLPGSGLIAGPPGPRG